VTIGLLYGGYLHLCSDVMIFKRSGLPGLKYHARTDQDAEGFVTLFSCAFLESCGGKVLGGWGQVLPSSLKTWAEG